MNILRINTTDISAGHIKVEKTLNKTMHKYSILPAFTGSWEEYCASVIGLGDVKRSHISPLPFLSYLEKQGRKTQKYVYEELK